MGMMIFGHFQISYPMLFSACGFRLRACAILQIVRKVRPSGVSSFRRRVLRPPFAPLYLHSDRVLKCSRVLQFLRYRQRRKSPFRSPEFPPRICRRYAQLFDIITAKFPQPARLIVTLSLASIKSYPSLLPLIFAQKPQRNGNLRGIEKLGRHGNYARYQVGLHNIFSDFALAARLR